VPVAHEGLGYLSDRLLELDSFSAFNFKAVAALPSDGMLLNNLKLKDETNRSHRSLSPSLWVNPIVGRRPG